MTITKFTHGAWLIFLAIPILSFLMIGVHRYYRDVEHEIAMDDRTHFGSTGDVALILVNKLQKPVVKAVDYALAAKHDKTFAVHISVTKEECRGPRGGMAGAPHADPAEDHRVAVPHLRQPDRRVRQGVPASRTARR